VSDILFALLCHSATQSRLRICVCVKVCVGGCFVLLADSSPPRIGPGRCRGVTMVINCLQSPVCVAACLPCRCVLGGFRVVAVLDTQSQAGCFSVYHHMKTINSWTSPITEHLPISAPPSCFLQKTALSKEQTKETGKSCSDWRMG